MSTITITEGVQFGRLKVVKFSHSRRSPSGKKRNYWLCKCSCGKEKPALDTHLRNKHIRSCGCLSAERTAKRATKHGLSRTKLYKVWSSMKSRCEKPGFNHYSSYGGRGIRVCREWSTSFLSFAEFAKSNGYLDGLTIDRIDNNGNYCPSNCRFVSRRAQSANMRSNVFIQHNGERKHISEWARALGVHPATLAYRLKHWPVSKALST
jgi:hypothetical protein